MKKTELTNQPVFDTFIWVGDTIVSLLGDFCMKGVGNKLLLVRMKLKPNETEAYNTLLNVKSRNVNQNTKSSALK